MAQNWIFNGTQTIAVHLNDMPPGFREFYSLARYWNLEGSCI